MIVNIPFGLGYGLTEYIEFLGYSLCQRGEEWHLDGPDTVGEAQAIIDLYNPWPVEKAKKLAEIDQDFSAATDNLTAGWPQHEIQTWNKQESEARALVQNADAPTPRLSTIAIIRGLTAAELAQRVIREADAFTAASANLVGLRYKARQLVQDLPDSGDYHRLSELFSIKFGG
jgi:hypothetical protein